MTLFWKNSLTSFLKTTLFCFRKTTLFRKSVQFWKLFQSYKNGPHGRPTPWEWRQSLGLVQWLGARAQFDSAQASASRSPEDKTSSYPIKFKFEFEFKSSFWEDEDRIRSYPSPMPDSNLNSNSLNPDHRDRARDFYLRNPSIIGRPTFQLFNPSRKSFPRQKRVAEKPKEDRKSVV